MALGAVALAAAACSGDEEAAEQPAVEQAAPDPPSIRVATLNVLHGNPIAVPECAANDQCGAEDRVELLMGHITDSDCPEVVTLQEVDTRIEALIDAALPQVCDDVYASYLVADQAVSLGIDREMILTTLPVESETLLDLPTVPWSAHHVRLTTPIGPVDLVTTHLASGSNNPTCAETECVDLCRPEDDSRLCGARQILEHVDRVDGDGDSTSIITGDLNAEPGEPAHELFVDAGFLDAHAESGKPECTDADRSGCTGGRSELELTDPAAGTDSRIDYILVRSGPACGVRFASEDVHPWADRPADAIGVSGAVFVSDHNGVIARITCS